MLVRHLRLLTAGLTVAAAIFLAPAQSRADVQILVEELDASGNVVSGLSQFTSGTPNAAGFVSYSFTGQYFTVGGTVATNSDQPLSNASLTPSFSGRLTSQFDASQNRSLRITVTDDGFTSTGQSGTLTNSAGVSRGFDGGTVQVDTFSSIYNPQSPGAIPASSTTQLAGGASVAGPTDTASASLPANSNLIGDTSLSGSGLPNPYAIQQVIIISFSQTGTIPPASTFGGSGGASIVPGSISNPVPAPAGLALALIGLPALGLRRVFGKR